MKKILLFLFALSFGAPSFAQDPDLYRTWYLYVVRRTDLDEIVVVSEIDPPIHPWITISETLEFNGEGACNTFMGTYSYYPTYNNFVSSDLTSSTNNCNNQTHNDFENQYFDFMNEFLFEDITPDSNGLILSLYNVFGGQAFFRDYPLSVNDLDFKAEVILSPNPVSEQLVITSENLQIETITIYEVSGKIVKQFNTVEGSIDVSSLSEGVYFIEINSEEGKHIKKFIKD